MYILYYNNEIRYITNNFHDSIIVLLQFIKDNAYLIKDISNINTYIVEYYGENYVLFANKYTFSKDLMSIIDMNNNKVYITNKFDVIVNEIGKLLNIEQNINTKKTISVKANLELLEEEKKIKLEKQNMLLKKNIDVKLEEEDKIIHDTNEEEFKNKMEKYKTEIKKQEFLGNIKTYYKLKKDIEENKLIKENIAEFFREKFNILEYLDNKNLLDFKDNSELIDNSFKIYLSKLKPEKETKKKYVPHNVHYLDNKNNSNLNNISELDFLNTCKLDLSELY